MSWDKILYSSAKDLEESILEIKVGKYREIIRLKLLVLAFDKSFYKANLARNNTWLYVILAGEAELQSLQAHILAYKYRDSVLHKSKIGNQN